MLTLRKVLLVVLLAPSLLLGGCQGSVFSNFRELEDLELVRVIGIDVVEDDVKVSISTGQNMGDIPPVRMCCTAPSITEAMRNLQRYTASEELYYVQTSYILLGEETAKGNIAQYLDYIVSSAQMRLNIILLVVKDGEAEPLVTGAGGKEHNITDILSSIQRDSEKSGTPRLYTAYNVASDLACRGSALVCAITEVSARDSVFDEEGKPSEENTALTNGYAVIKDGALVGFIDGSIAIGVALLQGMNGAEPVVLDTGDGKSATVNLETAGSKLSCEWDEAGKLATITVDCELAAKTVEQSDPDSGGESLTLELERALEEKSRGWIEEVLALSAELGTDFVGLGDRLRMKYPEKFAAMEAELDGVIGDVSFEVRTNASLARSYDTTEPLNITGGDDTNA